MSTILKALKLLRSPARLPSSLRLPIPQLRPLLRFSTTTTTYARYPKQKLNQLENRYRTIALDIAGTQLCVDNASPGEDLVVRREPGNEYDYNAFRIDKANGAKVGYVPAILAEKLAPLVDGGFVTLKMIAKGHVAANIEVFGLGKMNATVRTVLRTKEWTQEKGVWRLLVLHAVERTQEQGVRKLLHAEERTQERINIHTDSFKYWAKALLTDLLLDFHHSLTTNALKTATKQSVKAAARAFETATKSAKAAAKAVKMAKTKSAKATARARATAAKKSAKAAARALETATKKSAKAAVKALETERKYAEAAARSFETATKKYAETAARALETEMKKSAKATARALKTEMKKSAKATA